MQKIIFVSGASSGIGYDTAKSLARLGHKVYAGARRTALMEPLREYGVIPLELDVTDPLSRNRAISSILEQEGRLDVLVNNAGYGYFGAIETVSGEEARRQLEVNLFGLSELCRLVLPGMRERGGGRIINVSSVAGKAVLYFGGWYHVSKFAVEAFSDSLRMEMAPFGVDVVIIEPGGIKTDWGTIAADHLIESSAGTPYEKPAANEAGLMREAYTSTLLSDPSVVTKAIVRAVESKRPRARYRVGFGSRAMVWSHAILPDRAWDRLMRKAGSLKVKLKH